MDWQPISTIPLKQKIRIKTSTGMERIAVCLYPRKNSNKASCFSKDRKNTGDLTAVAWLPIDSNDEKRP